MGKAANPCLDTLDRVGSIRRLGSGVVSLRRHWAG